MTQVFTYRGFSLMKAPFHVKALVTAFIGMMAIGVGIGFVNYQVRTGLATEGSEAWYREGRPAAPSAAGMEPGEEPPLRGKTVLELLDVAHVHFFNMAFLFFVLGHLLALCAVKPALKITIYLIGFGGVAIDVASPWLIRFVAPGFSVLQLAGHVLLALATIAMTAIPLWEMWGRRRARESESLPVP